MPRTSGCTRVRGGGETANPDDTCSPGPGCGTGWNRWRTTLTGGMREGGRVVWALDVTNPPDFNSASGEQPTGPAYPAYLWEFPCEASACDSWRPYMGQTWSQPVITRVRATVDGPVTGPSYDRWVAIFGAGYDPQGDPNLAHQTDSSLVDDPADPLVYDAGSDAALTSVAGRAVFMVDMASGQVLAAKRFDVNGSAGDSSDGEPGMAFAFAADPAVFDIDRDGYADVVYIGDLGGNVWKWVIDEPAEDHINGISGDDHQDRWSFFKLFTAESCTTCSPKHYKSFFFPPTGALVGRNLWLTLGSGERNDLDFGEAGGPDVPLDPQEKNRFYVFKDPDPFDNERPAIVPYNDTGTVTPAQFVDITSITGTNPNTCLPTGSVGFYLEGAEGEKFVTDTSIFFGVVLTGSYVPAAAGASVCDSVGEGFIYGFNLLCGEGAFPPTSGDPSDPAERRLGIGIGLPNAPRVSVGPVGGGGGGGGGGCADMVMVMTSDGQAITTCPGGRPDSGVHTRSWRDF